MKKMLFCGLVLMVATPVWALDPDFQLLRSVGVEPTGPALLKYFKERTVSEADPKELSRLIRQLGDDSFVVRAKAYQEILKIGPASLIGLKLAEDDPDLEIKLRVDEIKKLVMAKVDPSVQAAAARLLTAIRPAGTTEVLLNYLPFAPDQSVADELCTTIKATAIRDGKIDPLVIKALTDQLAIKRVAAVDALFGEKEYLPAIRKMLKDASPLVRLRVATALVSAKEKDAVPVLVELLGVLNPEQLWYAEELLRCAAETAGKEPPFVALGSTDDTRKKCREAWEDWMAKNGDKMDLAKLEQVQPHFGFTLIVQQSLNRIVGNKRLPAMGEVMELDQDRKVRWKFEVDRYPVDAQVVRRDRQDRVLVAEYHGVRVTERDFTGKILWEQNVGGNPIGVQGLPNGNVFVVMQNRLVEYDRDHKEVFSMARPNHDIFRGKKLRNGEVVFVTNGGQLTRMDSKNQVIKTFNVGNIPVLFGSIDILAGGGVLVPDFHKNQVIEYDADGKAVKDFRVQWANSVQRLPNGNTLVGSQNTRRVMEFNTRGEEIWSYNSDGMVFNARKR
jgi:hypothetical protein